MPRNDRTSIAATIEARWHLDPLGTRIADVNDISDVFSAGKKKSA